MQSRLRENPEFMTKIEHFLSAGLSRSPKDIFSDMGIDITDVGFWSAGLAEVETLLDQTEQLAHKLGKIVTSAD